ncbi:MAG: cytochrome c biogenesis protein CcdA [Planctomycetota bacterium]
MFESLAETLAETVRSNPWLAPFAALLGGLLTAANPCVLAMVPLMVAYVAAQEGRGERRVAHSFLLSLVFCLGLTITFGVLFLAAWASSSFLNAEWWTYVAGGICLLMGLHLLGAMDLSFAVRGGIQPRRRGFLGALLLGLCFGLVSLPCAGPVLLALLAVVPLQGILYGGILLAAYGLGHCALVLVGGTSMGLVQRMADSRGWNRAVGILRRGAGVLILAVGTWLLFRR